MANNSEEGDVPSDPDDGLCAEKMLLRLQWFIENFKFIKDKKKLTSPIFQIRNATWRIIIELIGKKRLKFYMCIHHSEIEDHSFNVQMKINGKQKKYKNYTDVRFSVSTKKQLVLYIINDDVVECFPDDDVTVSCTFFEEIECSYSEENKKKSISCEKYSRKSVEGTDILVTQMKNLFLNRENCDFIIKVKDREFQVHKTILCARSPILSAMLQHDMVEKKNNATEIVDCEPEAFEQFLLYLYTGQVEELSCENATSLYFLGDKYDLEHLRKECVEYMENSMCVEAFCDFFALAVKHNVSKLVKRAEEFFTRNAKSILLTPKWQLLMKEKPVICNEIFIKYVDKISV